MTEITFDKQAIINELHCINDFIRWAASMFNEHQLFFGHGNSNAIDEAAYLILHALHLENKTPSIYLTTRLLDYEKNQLIDVIEYRIKSRLPAAYITHEVFFSGLTFYVDERVIIPRSPIAEMIENHFAPWVDATEVHNILDLCTGSGCIAIACAYVFPNAEIDAIELSEDALEVAQINVSNHDAHNNVNLIKSDLFKAIEGDNQNSSFLYKYDIIVSNPPYVDQEDMDALPEEYLAEPELALTAGDDGLGLVIPILQQAKRYLSPRGILVVEVGNSQFALQDTFPQVPFYWLEFERGGQGVFLLTAEQLNNYF